MSPTLAEVARLVATLPVADRVDDTADRLAVVAAILATVPHLAEVEVRSLDNDEPVRAVADLPGATSETYVYEPDQERPFHHALDIAEARFGGMRVKASGSIRPATEAEIATKNRLAPGACGLAVPAPETESDEVPF